MLSNSIEQRDLLFSDYIHHCQNLIKKNRQDLGADEDKNRLIISANLPYELYPEPPIQGKKIKYGVVLLHGLLDCPFTLRELATHLQKKGMLCRAMLTPGHGTHPQDLFSVSYNDWIATMQYGITSLQSEVEQIFIIGYSTGAALALYQALYQPDTLSGIVLLSPAIKLKPIIELAVFLHNVKRKIGLKQTDWLSTTEEIDYVKYQSIPTEAVRQVSELTALIRHAHRQKSCSIPMLMALSKDDETTCSESARHFFSQTQHDKNKLIWYAMQQDHFDDKRIIIRNSTYPELNIRSFSHICLPFSSHNPHYGQQGDFLYASHPNSTIYGSYNRIEVDTFSLLNQIGLTEKKRRELTYNPDFNFLADSIDGFINSI